MNGLRHFRCVPGHGALLDEVRVDGERVTLVEHGAGQCLGDHTHDTAKICIVLGGGVSERCRGMLLLPGALDPVFRQADVVHANQYHAAGARSVLVEMDPSQARGLREGLASDVAAARRSSARLARALTAPRSSRARIVAATVRSLRELFAAPLRPVPSWLDASRAILAERATEPPSLAELGHTLGVHPNHLAHAFRARFGVTTRAFVRAHRVFRAMEMIDRGAPLADAALSAGFADQSHMTRAVHAERGASPGALRRS